MQIKMQILCPEDWFVCLGYGCAHLHLGNTLKENAQAVLSVCMSVVFEMFFSTISKFSEGL